MNRGVVKQYRRLKQLRTSFTAVVLIPFLLLCVTAVCSALYAWIAPAKLDDLSEYDGEQWRRANSFFHVAAYSLLASLTYATLVPALCTVLVAAVIPKGIRGKYVFVWAAWIPLPFVLIAMQLTIILVVGLLFRDPWD